MVSCDRLFPFLRVRFHAAFGERLVGLQRRFVQPQLNHRQIGSRGLQEIVESKPRQVELRLIELVEAVAEVDQHQVAFVSEQGEQRRLAIGLRLHLGQQLRGFGGDLAAGVVGEARQAVQRKRIIWCSVA